MNDAIATLVSVPFAVAVTALLRKRWPQIDGAAVYLVVFALTIIGAVLVHYRAQIPAEVWTAAGPLLAAVLALGGVTTAQHVASSAGVTVEGVTYDPREAPTVKDRPTVPPENKP